MGACECILGASDDFRLTVVSYSTEHSLLMAPVLRRIWAISKARTLEFWRDRGSVAWAICLPLFIIVGFRYGLSDREPVFRIAYTSQAPGIESSQSIVELLQYSRKGALKKLEYQQVDLVYDSEKGHVYHNPQSEKSQFLLKTLRPSWGGFEKQESPGQAIRYVDWLFPGILGMNLMFACIFGIGYVIVRYRNNGVLKRYSATPMSAVEFLIGQLLSRFVIVLVTNMMLYFGCVWFLEVRSVGSHMLVVLITIVGSWNMMALGLVIAARIKSEELVGSLLNLVTIPMMIVSGTWFSIEGLSPGLRKIADYVPMTPINESLRLVMLEGAGLADISWHLVYLFASGAVVLAFSSAFFKWDSN